MGRRLRWTITAALLLFCSSAFSESLKLETLKVKNWEFRQFNEKSFFNSASQGASGVFISPSQDERLQIFVYRVTPEAQATPRSLQAWRKLVYPAHDAKRAKYLNEVSSENSYQGQLRVTRNGSTGLYTVLALRNGNDYSLFIQSDDGSLARAHYDSVNAFFRAVRSK